MKERVVGKYEAAGRVFSIYFTAYPINYDFYRLFLILSTDYVDSRSVESKTNTTALRD